MLADDIVMRSEQVDESLERWRCALETRGYMSEREGEEIFFSGGPSSIMEMFLS